jgi:DNA-binding transcriptional regulator YbjK
MAGTVPETSTSVLVLSVGAISYPRYEVSESRVPQQARGEERRERILRATLAVIGRLGISAVTHRSVAEEAGVPLGSLTYWFATKDDLLREALRRFVGDEAERLRGLAEQLGPDAEPAAIAERYASVLEDNTGPEQITQFELYLEAARNPALRDSRG